VNANGLIRLLVGLLILALVVWVAYMILGFLPLPYPAKEIACLILAVVFLVVLLKKLDVMD
jgi:putative effector of murein hydrolase LrgA (UPF0299 family)